MEHLFVSYEISKQLKEKGFDEICLSLIDEENKIHPMRIDDFEQLHFEQHVSKYNNKNCVPAPLYQQVIDWFREKHKIFPNAGNDCSGIWTGWIESVPYRGESAIECETHKDYYEALNSALTEALKLL